MHSCCSSYKQILALGDWAIWLPVGLSFDAMVALSKRTVSATTALF